MTQPDKLGAFPKADLLPSDYGYSLSGAKELQLAIEALVRLRLSTDTSEHEEISRVIGLLEEAFTQDTQQVRLDTSSMFIIMKARNLYPNLMATPSGGEYEIADEPHLSTPPIEASSDIAQNNNHAVAIALALDVVQRREGFAYRNPDTDLAKETARAQLAKIVDRFQAPHGLSPLVALDAHQRATVALLLHDEAVSQLELADRAENDKLTRNRFASEQKIPLLNELALTAIDSRVGEHKDRAAAYARAFDIFRHGITDDELAQIAQQNSAVIPDSSIDHTASTELVDEPPTAEYSLPAFIHPESRSDHTIAQIALKSPAAMRGPLSKVRIIDTTKR